MDENKTEDSEASLEVNHTSQNGSGCNPNLGNKLEPEEEVKIKGDAIGDTLYSEKFVLQTMLILAEITKENNDFKWSEDMENDLCSLWDMTTEKDVVFFLLEHGFVELSLAVIKKSEEIRLTEIMVGIVGNMCWFHESCNKVFESEYQVYLSLIKITDTPLLVQLMKLFKSLLYEDAKHFDLIITGEVLEQVKFFLSSSQNSELLLYTLQTLELIIDKKKTEIIDVDILLNINEAFRQLYKNLSDTSEFLSQENEKIITAYLKTLQVVSLSVKEIEDKEKYKELVSILEEKNEITLSNFETILSLFCDAETSFMSHPENIDFYIDCIVQFLNLLISPYSDKILKSLLMIYDILLSDDIQFDVDILNDVVDIVCKLVKIGETKSLQKVIEFMPKEKIIKILKEDIVKHKTTNCDKTYLDKINELISS